ncbi:MAG: hypothetical protein LQ341_006978 [Variospora aurantia]|nr:MAG: hypothetical protein LQ341_006978 [Variospora aurantia]
MAKIDPYTGKESTFKDALLIPTMKVGGLCAFRMIFLRTLEIPPSSPPQERVFPSTLAGAFTGAAGGAVLRGRFNIVPGIIMFSLFGFTGQRVYNALDASPSSSSNPTLPIRTTTTITPSSAASRPSTNDAATQPLWKRILNSKYSPMKVLSDEQYGHLLREKLVRVDAEIAIVDEEIGKVKAMGDEKDVDRRDQGKA